MIRIKIAVLAIAMVVLTSSTAGKGAGLDRLPLYIETLSLPFKD